MWKLPAIVIAIVSRLGYSRVGLPKSNTGSHTFQAVDVPLERWKRVRADGRVMELLHAEHFDDILKDAPDNVRPPSLIYVHDSSSPDRPGTATIHDYLEVARRGYFGEREELLLASYDAGEVPKRIWFRFSPERNLTHRFLRPQGIVELPKLVYVPRKCNGWTEWCDPGGKERIIGGECYVEQCSDWNVIEPDRAGLWIGTAKQLIAAEEHPVLFDGHASNMKEQGQLLRSRDTCTTREHLEALQQPRSLPRFTKKGFKVMEIPQDLQDVLLQFYKQYKETRFAEAWNFWGQTQLNCHETGTYMVDIQASDHRRNKYYDEVVRVMHPRLEKWVGVPLELQSLYGMREYTHPAILRRHLDRADVLVVSVTFSVYQEGFDHKKWPLEVISFDGNQYRMEHPQGTMMYYESATISHGKPGKLPEGGLHAGLFLHFRPVTWANRSYTEFSQKREGMSVVIHGDDRPRAAHQEGWPGHYYSNAPKDETDSEYSDLNEGYYLAMNHTCADATEQRDDAGFALGISNEKTWVPHEVHKRMGEALLQSVYNNNPELVATLLDQGADIEFMDENGWRAIHEAGRSGNVKILTTLISRGADVKALTLGQQSALDLARWYHGDKDPHLLEILSTSEL